MTKTWEAVLDPDEIRDFGVDWTPQLSDTLTIIGSTWSLVSGVVTIVANSFTDTGTTVRLTGGTIGEVVLLLNTVTLTDGERYQQTCQLLVQQR